MWLLNLKNTLPSGIILREELKEQHLSTVPKSCSIGIMCSNIWRNQLQVYYFFSKKKKKKNLQEYHMSLEIE